MSKSGWRTFKICKKKKLYVYHVKYTSSVWTLSDKLFIDINKANYWQRYFHFLQILSRVKETLQRIYSDEVINFQNRCLKIGN